MIKSMAQRLVEERRKWADEVINWLNALDTEDMTVVDLRSAFHKKLMEE